jgi:uncharacterized lipoprotein YmbA
MMRLVPLLCAVMPMLAMCGCRSTPIAYYTLTPANRSGTAVDSGRAALKTMLVLRSLPAGIDTTQILIRTDDARLRVDEGGRWVVPLGEELRGALVDALRHQYGIIVLDSVRHTDAPVPRIDLAVRRFDFVEGGSVTLAVDWVLSNPGHEPDGSSSCQAEITETSTATVGGAVMAGQAAALKLARVLGAAVAASSSGGTPAC